MPASGSDLGFEFSAIEASPDKLPACSIGGATALCESNNVSVIVPGAGAICPNAIVTSLLVPKYGSRMTAACTNADTNIATAIREDRAKGKCADPASTYSNVAPTAEEARGLPFMPEK